VLGALSSLILMTGLAACAPSATVNTDFDPTADFTAPKTYSWREGTKLPNPLMEQRIVNAVDAQLQAKGLQRVEEGGDLWVTYHASAEESMDIQSFETGSPYGCWGGCMSSTSTTVRPVTTGTLIVDLVNAKTNQLMWRGAGSDTITGDPEDTERTINEVIYRMFGEFPPKK